MLRVVGAETPAAELVLHLEGAVVPCRVGDVLAVDGGVRPALGIEAVGAADEEVVESVGERPRPGQTRTVSVTSCEVMT